MLTLTWYIHQNFDQNRLIQTNNLSFLSNAMYISILYLASEMLPLRTDRLFWYTRKFLNRFEFTRPYFFLSTFYFYNIYFPICWTNIFLSLSLVHPHLPSFLYLIYYKYRCSTYITLSFSPFLSILHHQSFIMLNFSYSLIMWNYSYRKMVGRVQRKFLQIAVRRYNIPHAPHDYALFPEYLFSSELL